MTVRRWERDSPRKETVPWLTLTRPPSRIRPTALRNRKFIRINYQVGVRVKTMSKLLMSDWNEFLFSESFWRLKILKSTSMGREGGWEGEAQGSRQERREPYEKLEAGETKGSRVFGVALMMRIEYSGSCFTLHQVNGKRTIYRGKSVCCSGESVSESWSHRRPW